MQTQRERTVRRGEGSNVVSSWLEGITSWFTTTQTTVQEPEPVLCQATEDPDDPFSIWRRRKSRSSFISDLCKGDILISRPQNFTPAGVVGQFIGHAAIMATENWIVEMPGEVPNSGSGSSAFASYSSRSGSSDYRQSKYEGNNRRIGTSTWYDDHLSDNILVYRCTNSDVAGMAGDWAYTHYYNSDGGEKKNIHVKYSIVSPVFSVRDPCYCSKLVLQSYYYGTGNHSVLWPTVEVPVTGAILPTTIPTFFKPRYSLSVVGLY